MALALDVLGADVGVEIHRVVRIDEVDREVPVLPLGAQRLGFRAQPRDRGRERAVVVGIAAQGSVDHVADAEEVLEAVGLQGLAIVEQGRVDRLVVEIEVGRQMPLALIGGVIAQLGQPVADRLDVRREVALPDRAEVVGDAGVLDVLAGIDDRARRGADAGGRLVVEEGDGLLLDRLAPRHRERPGREEVFLVDQHEEDVVAGGHRGAGGSGWSGGRCLSLRLRDTARQQGRAEQGDP